MKMGVERLAKKAFRWNPPDKKKGRPKKMWIYGVLEDRTEYCIT